MALNVKGKFHVKLATDRANDGHNLMRRVVYVELQRQVVEDFFSS
jgi:hypothetical protein